MAMFHVVVRRSGPAYDPARPLEEQSGWAAHAAFMDGLVDAGFLVLGGPLEDEERVVHAARGLARGGSRDARARSVERIAPRRRSVEAWTIRLDGTRR